MENIEKIKEELFKDFKPNYEINEDTPIYIAKLCGDHFNMSAQAPGLRHGDSAPFCFARETKSL